MAADSDRLRQIFWNLLSNGVRCTAAKGEIQILSHRINSHIEVVVKDNGIGIEPELLPYVFDRFRQGDTRAATNQGLGLGLAIVRNLVELHGGTVRAESDGVGRGTTFTVRLPTVFTVSDAEEAYVDSAAEKIPVKESSPSLQNLRILVVDDEARSRDVLTAILKQAEAEVRAVESATEALDLLDEWRPDLLVADIGMPNVDGYEFIRRVRARSPQRGGTVPAAALTAYARTQDRMRVLSEGYQMHVPKPIQPDELVTVVASLARRL
jgi:CheY-like chemotaxis protein